MIRAVQAMDVQNTIVQSTIFTFIIHRRTSEVHGNGTRYTIFADILILILCVTLTELKHLSQSFHLGL